MTWLSNFDRIAVSAMVAVSLAVFSVTLVRAVGIVPAWDNGLGTVAGSVATSTHATTTAAMVPLRLMIPALDISARVQQVGVTAKGNVGIPTNYSDVAWYQGGPAPGAGGMAIIDGHADNGLGMPGVFSRIGELGQGDEIFVRSRDGATRRFVVYDVASYPYQSVPMKEILAARDPAELALISCEGEWLRQLRTYDRRIVVYARLAEGQ
jgi:sortase A